VCSDIFESISSPFFQTPCLEIRLMGGDARPEAAPDKPGTVYSKREIMCGHGIVVAIQGPLQAPARQFFITAPAMEPQY